MTRVFIVAARRTPFGRFRGSLANVSAVEMASEAARAVMVGIEPSLVDQVIVGNVLSAGNGMNIARQVALNVELPVTTPAFTVNMMCGSGMQSALLAVQSIRSGESHVALVGGVESMSQAPMLIERPAKGAEASAENCVDSILCDGLVDSFSQMHMAETVDALAQEMKISRREQDAWAERSQRLYAAALAADVYRDEIVAVGECRSDEHPRPQVDRTSLAALKPAFDEHGTVTAGNASGLNDGAAMLLIASEAAVQAYGWPIMAEWIAGTTVGCEPLQMGLGPVHAIRKLLTLTGQTLDGIDRLEINEAFAAQTLACLRILEIRVNLSQPDVGAGVINGIPIQVNAHGGAIAIGHPLGASGARLLTHLAWQIASGNSRTAIASLCIGGGMGIATLLSAPPEHDAITIEGML